MLSLSQNNLCDLMLCGSPLKLKKSFVSVFGAALQIPDSSAYGNSTNDCWKCTYTESFLIVFPVSILT